VLFDLVILIIIDGRMSMEVNAKLSFDLNATIDKARDMINLDKNKYPEKKY
jgi:transaldolase